MPQWHLTHGESYLVTGEPVIVSDLTSSISHSIELLLIAVLLVMAGTLGLVFTGRPRLLPLALALLAAALTFGALSARWRVADDGLDRGAAGARRPRGRLRDPVPGAHRRAGRALRSGDVEGRRAELICGAAAAGGPTIVTAAAASAAAMLVLLLSPVPMVRGFGVLLVVGVAVALLCALTAGAAAASLPAAPGRPRRPRSAQGPWRPRGAARRAASGQPADADGRARGARRGGAPPRALPVRGPRAGGARLGPRHADEGADGHHQAGPAEPRLAAEPRHRRAHHRRRRRNRPDGRRAGTC